MPRGYTERRVPGQVGRRQDRNRCDMFTEQQGEQGAWSEASDEAIRETEGRRKIIEGLLYCEDF